MACQDIEFTIRKGDLLPVISATLYNKVAGVETPVDLSSATLVNFIYKKFTGAVVTKVGAVVAPATAGKVSYTWVAGDTDTVGDYHSYWKITFSSGKTSTYPNDGYNVFRIEETL